MSRTFLSGEQPPPLAHELMLSRAPVSSALGPVTVTPGSPPEPYGTMWSAVPWKAMTGIGGQLVGWTSSETRPTEANMSGWPQAVVVAFQAPSENPATCT